METVEKPGLKPVSELLGQAIAGIQKRIEEIRQLPQPEEGRRIEDILQASAVERARKESIFGDRYRERGLAQTAVNAENAQAMERALLITQNPRLGTTFYGPIGTGKTHIAAAIAAALIDEGTVVVMESVTGLLARLRAAYDPEASTTEFRLMRQISNAPVLIIDDLGKERFTAWSCATMWELLNTRYERGLPLITTTNLTKAEMRTRYQQHVPGVDPSTLPAIFDRLLEMADPWIEIRGTSRRSGIAYPKAERFVL